MPLNESECEKEVGISLLTSFSPRFFSDLKDIERFIEIIKFIKISAEDDHQNSIKLTTSNILNIK